jgi:predicted O-methyltransferase YrrM
VNEFLKADAGLKQLLKLVYAPMYTKVLFAGIELGLFAELERAWPDREIAAKLGLHPENTRYLLDALAAMELVEKREGLYRNTAISSKYLRRDGEMFIGQYLRAFSSTSGFDNLDIVKSVKEGPVGTGREEGLEAHEVFGDYTKMLQISQKTGRAAEIAELVAALPEFGRFRKMLDLGGGPGLLGMAVVQAHPELKGVIFETPAVGDAAIRAIEEYGMTERVTVLTGDYLNDLIGAGYDLVLASGTLNFAKHNLDGIIKKIYDALNPQGVLICISDGLTHEKTRPAEMVIGWLPSFLKGYDFSLEQGMVSDAALRNGFRSVYKRTMNFCNGELDVDIARKLESYAS